MSLEWTTLTTKHLDGARHSSAFAKVGDECFLIGGVTSDDKPSEESDSVVSYNYVTEQWTRHPNLPEPRTWCAAAAIDNTRLVVVGGFPLIEDTNSTLSSSSSSSSLSFLYDVDTRTWTTANHTPRIRRWWPACVVTNNNHKIYVIGGYNPDLYRYEDTTEVLDLSGKPTTWTLLPERMETARARCAATVDSKGNIVVTGGYNKRQKTLDTVEMFDTNLQTWKTTPALPPMSTPRSDHTVVSVGKLLVAIGGYTDESTATASAESILMDNDGNHPPRQWTQLPSMNKARASFGAFATTITTNQEGVVVAAGWDGKNEADTLELLQLPSQQRQQQQQGPQLSVEAYESLQRPTT